MSQNFKLKFDEMRQGNPAEAAEDNAAYQSHGTAGHVRNVCFEWPDGKMKFLNYGYLVSGEYIPNESKITLAFTSETVTIIGNNLQDLFIDLLNHSPKIISCIDDRYSNLQGKDAITIKEITITSPD